MSLLHHGGSFFSPLVHNNQYEFDLIDTDNDIFISSMWPNKIKYVSRKKRDRIKLSYLIKEKDLQKSPISTLFKNIFSGLLSICDDKGLVIHHELLYMEFHSSEVNMFGDHIGILTFDVIFEITKTELIDLDYKLNREKLIRKYKLDKLI